MLSLVACYWVCPRLGVLPRVPGSVIPRLTWSTRLLVDVLWSEFSAKSSPASSLQAGVNSPYIVSQILFGGSDRA